MSSKRKTSNNIPSNFGETSFGDAFDDYDSDTQIGTSSNSRKNGHKHSGSVGAGESGTVTKRTLQNRKAQREFRKRREARVRDLEERCRRFDQMGLEANMELQRVARNLKEENEALRGFVNRVGYGNMMSTILDGIGSNRGGVNHAEGSFQSAFAGNFGGLGNERVNNDDMFNNNVNNNNNVLQTSMDHHQNQRHRSKTTNDAPSHQGGYQDALSGQSWLDDGSGYNLNQEKKSSSNGDNNNGTPSSSDGTSSSSQNDPLLSLNLNQTGNQKESGQTQPEFTNTQEQNTTQSGLLPHRTVSPNTAMTNLLGQMNHQINSTGNQGGISGSAMLSNYSQNLARGMQGSMNNYSPYSIQRMAPNDALLNPNPIPFSFNLSNDPPQPNSSWWEQMGGTRFDQSQESTELDEKAQAVAAAQTNNGGTQSPFDLSAFLQGGTTPGGGGFNLGGFISEAAAVSSGGKEKGSTVPIDNNGEMNDTDHMRIFTQLLERKVAEREAHTVAALGFSPPSQDPSQRREKEKKDEQEQSRITFSSSMTPSSVYSRLAEHPAFLSTDARELEELVDAIGSGAARSPIEIKKQIKKEGSDSSVSSSDQQNIPSSSTSKNDQSRSSKSESPTSVEVDEGAIEKLLGLLDQKTITKGSSKDKNQNMERLTMAMT